MKSYTKRLVRLGVRTFAQVLGGVLTAAGTGLIDTDWIGALSASGMGALIAVLMNVGKGDTEPAPE